MGDMEYFEDVFEGEQEVDYGRDFAERLGLEEQETEYEGEEEEPGEAEGDILPAEATYESTLEQKGRYPIPREFYTTSVFYSAYEKSRVIGARARDIQDGAPPLISQEELEEMYIQGEMIGGALEIAEHEFSRGLLDTHIRRVFPNGGFEEYSIRELLDPNVPFPLY